VKKLSKKLSACDAPFPLTSTDIEAYSHLQKIFTGRCIFSISKCGKKWLSKTARIKDLAALLRPEGRFRGPGESKPPAGFAAFDRSKAEKILFLVEKPIINPKGKMVWKP